MFLWDRNQRPGARETNEKETLTTPFAADVDDGASTAAAAADALASTPPRLAARTAPEANERCLTTKGELASRPLQLASADERRKAEEQGGHAGDGRAAARAADVDVDVEQRADDDARLAPWSILISAVSARAL